MTVAIAMHKAPGARQEARISRIVLATDGSTHAMRAGDAARDIAVRVGATVDVVAAWDVLAASYAAPVIASTIVWAEAEAEARTHALHAAEELAHAGVAHPVPHVLEGRPSRRIAEVAAEVRADLVVMGSRGRGLVQRLVLGSTSEEVLHSCSRPVLVIRGGAAAWPPRRFLVAHDGSAAAHDAARLAATLGAALGVRVELMGVVTCDGPGRPEGAEAADLRRVLDSAATRIADVAGVVPEVTVVCGDPAHELLAAADRVPGSLLALGAGSDRTRARHHLGRTTARLVHGSADPILVAPATQDRLY